MEPDKSMMVTTGQIITEKGVTETFKIIPHNLKCPYNEAIYDVDTQVLFIISKEKKNNLHRLENKKENIIIEKYYEYQLITHNEIVNFVKRFCINHLNFDYLRYMQK